VEPWLWCLAKPVSVHNSDPTLLVLTGQQGTTQKDMKKLLILVSSLALAATSFAQLTSPRPSPDAVNVVTPTPTATPVTLLYGSPDTDVLHAKRILTPTEIKTMFTTAIEVVPAPGAGKTIALAGPVVFRYVYGTAAYTSGGALVVQYHTGTTAATATLAATALGAASTDNVVLPASTAIATAALQNNGLEVTNATGVFAGTTSTGTLEVNVYYRILPAL
jgi:hypothetical protein